MFNIAKNDTCSEVLKSNGNRVAGMIPYFAYMDTWIEYMGWIHDTLTEEKWYNLIFYNFYKKYNSKNYLIKIFFII